jgi:hypothetical protein
MGEMPALVTPLAAIRNPPIVGDPGLPNEPFTFQDFCGRQPSGAPICQDQQALYGLAESSVPVCPRNPLQAVLILVFVGVQRRAKSD